MCWRFLASRQYVPEDESQTTDQQNDQDQNGAVHKKSLGKDVDDLILYRIKQPIVLAGEEQRVEEGKGSVEIGGGQCADYYERCGQSRAGPERGAAAQQFTGPPPG